MNAEKPKVKATDPSWYWVVIGPEEDPDTLREQGYIIIMNAGALVRTSVPVEDDFPPTGDPHAANRWQ
ncbi:hypothetical protein PP187_gp333 [Klebsiella phage vB_KvM-Eowyn]|uniref:Uncharacterized protein n=1 Tax=Klebsiella phage vB_KvM-Eowyn TaxID=2762819 RepID=A0A7R8MJT3_9CAUD|nr:hypothetical protein PP187_gp333 [Klebsiella phage vB_KvM-Eowyn]CAD5236322.1 hypothetical protein LLCLJKAH_00333 [Klebsiella phage vB_KvM-Eowyn]